MWCCVAGYGGWTFLQIKTWWIGYLFGASDNWKAVYERTFSHTTKLLPSAGIHLAPDGLHLVLQLLLLAVVIFAVGGLLRSRRPTARRHSARDKRRKGFSLDLAERVRHVPLEDRRGRCHIDRMPSLRQIGRGDPDQIDGCHGRSRLPTAKRRIVVHCV